MLFTACEIPAADVREGDYITRYRYDLFQIWQVLELLDPAPALVGFLTLPAALDTHRGTAVGHDGWRHDTEPIWCGRQALLTVVRCTAPGPS